MPFGLQSSTVQSVGVPLAQKCRTQIYFLILFLLVLVGKIYIYAKYLHKYKNIPINKYITVQYTKFNFSVLSRELIRIWHDPQSN